jgi:hypothetical protein
MLHQDEYIIHEARIRLIAYIPALLLLILFMYPSRITGLASTRLALTNKRVIGQTGMFRRRKLRLELREVESVHAVRGMLGLLFNYGSVTISGNGSRMTFRGMANPKEMEMMFEEAIEVATLGRSLNRVDKPGPSALAAPAREPAPISPQKAEAPPFPPPQGAEPVVEGPPASHSVTPDAKYKDPDAW